MKILRHKSVRALCVAVCWSFSFCLAGNALGQFRIAHVPDRLHTTQAASLFLDIEDGERFDGALLAIPSSWRLDDVSFISASGKATHVRFRTLAPWTNRYLILPDRNAAVPDRLILTVRTGETTGTFRVGIAPVRVNEASTQGQVTVLEEQTVRAQFRIDEAHVSEGNLVLNAEAASSSPVSEVDAVIDGDGPFTAELWFKTVSRNAVILSSWDGAERSSYPLELMVDESGHIVFFRGRPGEHRSMRSIAPLADGDWHHVAVTHDDQERWSRMYIDGIPSDSIFHMSPLFVSTTRTVGLGGRPEASEPVDMHNDPFTGQLDEIRLWNQARDAVSIRTNIRRSIPSGPDVDVFSFEEGVSDPVRDALTGNTILVPSDLVFYEAISNFQVHLDAASILLEWQAQDPNVTAFLIERSANGMDFEPLARIETSDRAQQTGTDRWSRFRDMQVSFGVTYYRIRQVFSDGAETISEVVKVGMGVEEDQGSAVLTGNYPNPFNPTTTVTYLLREGQQVQVSVWDLAGQMVAVLVDGHQDAGEHQVVFDAKDLPSGTYFVRMRTAAGIRSHQIILMK